MMTRIYAALDEALLRKPRDGHTIWMTRIQRLGSGTASTEVNPIIIPKRRPPDLSIAEE